ncbi:MAG TPA: 50S ribosomal protein L13 [Candidatus Nanoarchaeia archaeon]|nr:50S ribosomal protein L13 [Candidatus Nanoarchaeia archaeon]
MNKQIVIDAKDAVLGRIASYAAKQALLGKNIIIVNCNDVLLTGRRQQVLEHYSHMRSRGKGAQKGPIIPRVAEKLMKRTVRGMLAYTQRRGEAALDRVICYNETPKEFESAKKISLTRELKVKTTTLKEIAKTI